MGSVLAMDHYQNVFRTGMTGEKVSVVTSLYTVYVSSFDTPGITANSLLPQRIHRCHTVQRSHFRQARSTQVHVRRGMGYHHRFNRDLDSHDIGTIRRWQVHPWSWNPDYGGVGSCVRC